jgi:S1-C subfamily serine protease
MLSSPRRRAMKVTSGALVTGITPGSPAAQAGLVAGTRTLERDTGIVCAGGDAITAPSGEPVGSMSALQNALDAHAPGSKLELGITHANGTRSNLSLTLVSQPASPPRIELGCEPERPRLRPLRPSPEDQR